jgi:CubicO group peptidase (beta-lactamase class C family)
MNRFPWNLRRQTVSLCLALAALVAGSAAVPAQQSPDPDSPRWKGVMALQEFFRSEGDKELDRFLKKKIAPELRAKYKGDSLRDELRRLRSDLSGMELQGARPSGPVSAVVTFGAPGGEAVFPFILEPKPPHRFLQIAFIGADEDADVMRETDGPPMAWGNLKAVVEQAAKDGFAGSVLVVRDGKTVLDRGYGMANREKSIPNRPDTIYAIGSTPIDFTRAGILLLAQRGKLSLSDPITKFFDDVPKDKRSLTIDHMMNGRSGLQDFLGRPSDTNPDHHYIDRDEAVRRIFEDKLHFEPGTKRQHSHAAFGGLAAIIELVSGQTYEEFTTEHLFKPAGMNDTGFYGVPYDENRMAVGYSDHTSGEINAPPYWGRTSWLVMGSGGQVSTTGDMYRWHRALADGKILQGEFLDQFWSPRNSLLAGGDMFGFEILYTQGPDTMMILVSNSGGPGNIKRFHALGEGLADLVNAESGPRFSLGVQMDMQPGRVVIVGVMDGSAAERDGLKAGDVILEIDGKPVHDDPLRLLDPFLETGKPIPFLLERNGTRVKATVQPNPK